MMSATKLIIHKFEGSTNIKTLHMILQDDDNSGDVLFGEWQNGETIQNKTNNERSARLVVKIVSDLNNNKMNLDMCARELEEKFETYVNKAKMISEMEYKNNTEIYSTENKQDYSYFNLNSDDKHIDSEVLQNAYNNKEQNNQINSDLMNPLEYSLEKVRENNARIMQNINLLNRTLYYTTKKEKPNIFAKSMRTFPCNTCGKCFVYETGLRRHYSMRHATTEIQPRWQIVWTCIQCFQVWPRQDQAIKHSIDCFKCENSECVREIKTSSLLQCEFCEKVFTSIPRLLRHSKTHTTYKNYECNTCGLAFTSYRTAEQHWISCPWLKMYYSFSLPKLLLCNACDRKFRSYDQLYNHRYKVGHFMKKTPGNDAQQQPMSVSVYQCEICGYWFSSVYLLIAHQSQCRSSDNNILTGYFLDKNILSKGEQEIDLGPTKNEMTKEEFNDN